MRLASLLAVTAAALAVAAPALADAVPPVVQDVAPSTGPATGGTTVTITGSHLGGTTRVAFGDTDAASFKVGNDETTITAVAPPGSAVVDVRVTTPAGTSARGSADRFRYLPAISSLDPDSGSVSGDTEVTIVGGGFTGATEVAFGTKPATDFTVVSDTKIVATAPEGGGAVAVTVTTPTGATPSGARYRYLLGVTRAEPGPGGNQVTLTGIGFGVATHVRLGGSFAGFVTPSDTKMIVAVPPGADVSSVTVVTPYGTTQGIHATLLPAGTSAGATGGTQGGSTFPQSPGKPAATPVATTLPAAGGFAGPVRVTRRAKSTLVSVALAPRAARARVDVAVVDAAGHTLRLVTLRPARGGTARLVLAVPLARIVPGRLYAARLSAPGTRSVYSAGFRLR